MDILRQVRNAIAVMRKWKEDNRMIGDMKCFVATDVYEKLKETGVMRHDICGKYWLDNIPVFELKGYPPGYVSVE